MGKLKKISSFIERNATTPRVAAVIIICILAASVLMKYPDTGTSFCVFRNISGHECPGCGMTRGFVAIGHGHLKAAVESNMLAPFVYIYTILYLLWIFVQEVRAKVLARAQRKAVLLDITNADR